MKVDVVELILYLDKFVYIIYMKKYLLQAEWWWQTISNNWIVYQYLSGGYVKSKSLSLFDCHASRK